MKAIAMATLLIAACRREAPAPAASTPAGAKPLPPLERYGCVTCHLKPPRAHYINGCSWCHPDACGATRLNEAGLQAETDGLGAVTLHDAVRRGEASEIQRAAFKKFGCVRCHAGEGLTPEGETVRKTGEGCRFWIEHSTGKE